MSRFSVNTEKLKTISSDLSGLSSELNDICSAVLTIQTQLAIKDTSRDTIVKALNTLESDILEEALNSSNLGKALILIAETYEKAEQSVLNQMDGTFSILDKLFEKIKDKAMGILEQLGLDDDYYRWKMGYESYDEEKTQEKLMDEYLQTTILGMLSKDRYSEETWNSSTVEERKEILTDFLAEINSIMGTDVDPNIIFSTSMSSSKRGYFTYPAKTVTINETWLSRADSYVVMRTLIHEMRHAYQHAAVDNPENFTVSEETLKQWENNFANYIQPKSDGSNYDKYVTQPIEYDAKSFAGQYGDIEGYTPTYGGSWE